MTALQSIRALKSDPAQDDRECMQRIRASLRILRTERVESRIAIEYWQAPTAVLAAIHGLAATVANLVDVKVWRVRSGEQEALALLGYTADVAAAHYMLRTIHDLLEDEWESFRQTAVYDIYSRNRRMQVRAEFLREQTSRLHEPLLDILARDVQERRLTGMGVMVVAEKRAKIAGAMARLGLSTPKRRTQSVGDLTRRLAPA